MANKIFGTDGIRGTANQPPMTAEITLRVGEATGAQFLRGDHRHRVVIAKDTRLSGYMLEPALTAGFISVGMDVVLVGPLPTPVIHQVVEKFVMQLEAQLSERGVTFELAPEAGAWLADKGYDEKMGARPPARVIQEHIKKPLADEVLFGKLKRGGTVKVTVVEDETGGRKIALEAIADEVPPAKPGKASRKRTAVAADGSEIEDDQIDEDDGDEDGDDPMSAAFDEETAAPAKSRAGSVPKVPRRSN